jgi:hypothetical protein
MILINKDPGDFFAEYQSSYINIQKMKLDDNKRKLIDKKLKLFFDNLLKLQE